MGPDRGRIRGHGSAIHRPHSIGARCPAWTPGTQHARSHRLDERLAAPIREDAQGTDHGASHQVRRAERHHRRLAKHPPDYHRCTSRNGQDLIHPRSGTIHRQPWQARHAFQLGDGCPRPHAEDDLHGCGCGAHEVEKRNAHPRGVHEAGRRQRQDQSPSAVHR